MCLKGTVILCPAMFLRVPHWRWKTKPGGKGIRESRFFPLSKVVKLEHMIFLRQIILA